MIWPFNRLRRRLLLERDPESDFTSAQQMLDEHERRLSELEHTVGIPSLRDDPPYHGPDRRLVPRMH